MSRTSPAASPEVVFSAQRTRPSKAAVGGNFGAPVNPPVGCSEARMRWTMRVGSSAVACWVMDPVVSVALLSSRSDSALPARASLSLSVNSSILPRSVVQVRCTASITWEKEGRPGCGSGRGVAGK